MNIYKVYVIHVYKEQSTIVKEFIFFSLSVYVSTMSNTYNNPKHSTSVDGTVIYKINTKNKKFKDSCQQLISLSDKEIREKKQTKLMTLFKGYAIMSTKEKFTPLVTNRLYTEDGKPYYLDRLLVDVAEIIHMREASKGKGSQKTARVDWLMVRSWMTTGEVQNPAAFQGEEDEMESWLPDLSKTYNTDQQQRQQE